ncbi:Xanthine dehydrogenase molybdopterin binding subunit [Candidatus Magnetomoraceae bacterium gMMP-1]
MKNVDSFLHVQGKSQFIDDAVLPEDTLYAFVLSSPVACAKITKLDTNNAEKIKGVYAVFTAADIPGENQIGKIIPDEPLLASGEVHYIGQPIAIIISKTSKISRLASRAIDLEFEKLEPVFDPREAFSKGNLITPPRTFSLGNVDKAWDECDVILEAKAETGGQEHVYLEPQGSFAMPTDSGVKIISSTQSPSMVQMVTAKILGLQMYRIEVDVMRLGGAFGGKEDQATPWAAMTALAAYKLKKTVKLVLNRQQDIKMTGKRHPYSSDFKIGLRKDGKILAYELTCYQNAGAAADLSPAIMERSLFHITNTYFIPNVRATLISCRTNLPPNTAFRGFGAPQAIFVIESAIFKAAEKIGISPHILQEKNLLKKGDIFPYGMKFKDNHALRCWDLAVKKYDLKKIISQAEKFNRENKLEKKGIALTPLCFGISFTAKYLNQASSLVHIYTDGCVSISTGAVEMGQGVKTKIAQVAAKIFSINLDKIKIESTNTTRIANMSPTAASTGADLNGKATELACLDILSKLKEAAVKKLDYGRPEEVQIKNERVYLADNKTNLDWQTLIGFAYFHRISLSAHAHYATPKIYFNQKTQKGSPFAYHVVGTAITEVTLDCLRGTYRIDSVKLVHDFGKSLNPLIDKGQVEGGVVQGIGWMTIEELMYSKNGRLQTDNLSTYKIPDIHFSPDKLEIHFLENSENPAGIFKSKAIGEPPFIYGIGAYFAIMSAIKAFNPGLDAILSAPLTPEKVLNSLYN